jgi:DNA polymerase-3 subunit alpha
MKAIFILPLLMKKQLDLVLGSIKNIGGPLVEFIEEERKRNGPFLSLADFLRRVKHKDLNKKSLKV